MDGLLFVLACLGITGVVMVTDRMLSRWIDRVFPRGVEREES